MNEDDRGSARMRQDEQAGSGARRRGPVIRTADFVSAKTIQSETIQPSELPPLSARQRLEQEWAQRNAAPGPSAGRQSEGSSETAATPVSDRLARLAHDAPHPLATPAHRPDAALPPLDPPAVAPLKPAQAHVLPDEEAFAAIQTPLLDAGMVMRSAWRHRLVMTVLILGMGLAGGLASPFLPRKFTASTTLYFDPQQVRLNDGGQAPALSQEQILAIIDSQAQILVSRRVLSAVASSMNLQADPEFGGLPGQTGAKLAKAVTVERKANTYVVNLSVKTKDPERSAAIANGIVGSFTAEQQSASDGVYDSANSTLDDRLGQLGQDLRKAEEAAAQFKAANDIDTAAATALSGPTPAGPSRIDQLETILLAAQGKTIAAKARFDAITKFPLADIASGTAPVEGTSTTLMQLQQQYAAAAATVASLETKLGSRHPQLQAARAAFSGVSAAVRRETSRLATSAQADYERARKEEEGVARELAVQKAMENNLSGRLIEYRELQRKADAAREIYETVLKRTRQTGEEQRLLKSNIRIISPAEAPLQADGPSRTVLMIGCIFGGILLGLMLGLLYAVVRLFAGRARQAG